MQDDRRVRTGFPLSSLMTMKYTKHVGSSLGSHLVGALYVLDEPSIGLHPRDTHRLIDILKSLRDLGNTILVVEHDPDTMPPPIT